MTFGNKEQFNLMLKALEESAKVFREKLTLNVVVTKINFNSVNKILELAKRKKIKVKLLEMTNGKQFPKIYVPFSLIVRSFKAKSIEYINSCCPANNCELCKRLYPVVRLSPDGKINGCIANEKGEKNILKAIKNRNENYIKKNLLSCLNKKKEANGIKLKTKTKTSLNILFICKYNRFRSRVAKAYFEKINKNKKIKVKSAGVIKGRPVSELSIKTAKKLGLDIRGKTRGLSTSLLIWQDMIIIVAEDVPPSIFSNSKKHGKKVIVWKIKDIPGPEGSETEKKKIIKRIIKKVDGLNKMLNKEVN